MLDYYEMVEALKQASHTGTEAWANGLCTLELVSLATNGTQESDPNDAMPTS